MHQHTHPIRPPRPPRLPQPPLRAWLPALVLGSLAPQAMALDVVIVRTLSGGPLPGLIAPFPAWEPELKGLVRIKSVQSAAELQHTNTFFAYDTELYFSALPEIGLPRDVRGPPVSGQLAPTQLRYALPGERPQVRAVYAYDFVSKTGSSWGTFKGGLDGPVDTRQDGLFMHLFNWTGDPGTRMDITSTKLTVHLNITDYQLFYNPNVNGIAVQRGDRAFNAEAFTNRSGISFDDAQLRNTEQGDWTNLGTVAAVAAGQTLVNEGGFYNGKGATVSSALDNSGLVMNLGTWIVSSDVPMQLTNNRGGIRSVDGGIFSVGKNASFSNGGVLAAADTARIVVDGVLSNFSNGDTASVTLTDSAQLQVRGTLINDASIGVQDQGRISIDSGGRLSTNGTVAVSQAASLYVNGSLNLSRSGRLVLNDKAYLQIAGEINNSGWLETSAQTFVNNLGSLQNESTGLMVIGGELRILGGNGRLTNHGSMRVASGGTLRNTASLQVTSGSWLDVVGRLSSSSPIVNVAGALLTVAAGGEIQASVRNEGKVKVDANGLLLARDEYRQTAGRTDIKGTLSATAIWIDGGDFSAPGIVRADTVHVGPGARIGKPPPVPTPLQQQAQRTMDAEPAPPAAPLLRVSGHLILDGAVIDLGIASADDWAMPAIQAGGEIHVSGGTLNLQFLNGYRPAAGARAALFGNSWVSGADSLALQVTGLPEGWSLSYDNGGLQLAAVPEPGTLALWLLGLLGLQARAHSARRQRRITTPAACCAGAQCSGCAAGRRGSR